MTAYNAGDDPSPAFEVIDKIEILIQEAQDTAQEIEDKIIELEQTP